MEQQRSFNISLYLVIQQAGDLLLQETFFVKMQCILVSHNNEKMCQNIMKG